MMFQNACHGLPDGSCDAGSGAFGGRAGAAILATEPDGATELAAKEVTFDLCLGGALAIAVDLCLLDVLVDLLQASPVHIFRLGVEHDAGIAGVRTSLDGDEVEGMEFATRSAEKASEVMQTLLIAQLNRTTIETERPVIAFTAKVGGRTEISTGGARVASCQMEASVGERGAGCKRLTFERSGDARELASRGSQASATCCTCSAQTRYCQTLRRG
jgi:hypothetical protein